MSPVKQGKQTMFRENASVLCFNERLALWLPGSFSLALMALSLLANPLFAGERHIQMPWYLGTLLVGVLGMTLQVALHQQGRKIQDLEAAMRRLAASSSS